MLQNLVPPSSNESAPDPHQSRLNPLHTLSPCFLKIRFNNMEARGSEAVKALCYKPEGRGFETR
jgi:hypothetical protein